MQSQTARSEAEILDEIQGIHTALSPENLASAGYRSRTGQRRVTAWLNRRLQELFSEIGREVDEYGNSSR